MTTITQNFKKLKKWFQNNYVEALDALNPPATEKQLQELKHVLGFDIPDELKELLRCHNGQKKRTEWFFEFQEFSPIERIISEYTSLKEMNNAGDFKKLTIETSKEIQSNTWWHNNWIPFTYDGAGNFYCIDTSPTPTGKYGQIITFYHDSNDRDVLANSLTEWFNNLVNDYLNGKYFFDGKNGLLKKLDIKEEQKVMEKLDSMPTDNQLFEQIAALVDKQIAVDDITEKLSFYIQVKELMQNKPLQMYSYSYEHGYARMVLNTHIILKKTNRLDEALDVLTKCINILTSNKNAANYINPSQAIYEIFYRIFDIYDDKKDIENAIKHAQLFIENCTKAYSGFLYDEDDADKYFGYLKYICSYLIGYYEDQKDYTSFYEVAKSYATMFERFGNNAMDAEKEFETYYWLILECMVESASHFANKNKMIDAYVKLDYLSQKNNNSTLQSQKNSAQKNYIQKYFKAKTPSKLSGLFTKKQDFITDKIKGFWQNFENHLQQGNPEALKSLNNGATLQEIIELENKLFTKLPDDFKGFLQVHNGQKNDIDILILNSTSLLSCENIAKYWQKFISTNSWDNPKHIPFAIQLTYDKEFYHKVYYFDLLKYEEENSYTIMVFDDEDFEGIVAHNFIDWLENGIKTNFTMSKLLLQTPYFENWLGYLDKQIVEKAEGIVVSTTNALKNTTDKIKQTEIIHNCVLNFNKLDKQYNGFIETIHREHICDILEDIANYYGIDNKNLDFDNLREW
jgi:cell wall assembly regulator SMI1